MIGEAPKRAEDTQVKISNGVSERELNVSTFPILSVDNKINGAAFVLSGNGAAKNNGAENGTDKNLFNYLENVYSHNSFFVKKDTRFVKVNFSEILWVEALDNYVIIKTISKDQFILHSSMKDIEAKLPPLTFTRVHRSFIVQLDKVTALEENACIVDGSRIPIGKSYRDALMNRINLL
jgi:DNA-binding LytR/AlgR family response regulator